MGEPDDRLLIIEARYYSDISDELAKGAIEALEEEGVIYDRIEVPGALEIPSVIAVAEQTEAGYDGYIALGCVIRGETSHYDIVAGESARGLMDLSIHMGLAIGNAILTVENEDQAWARARVSDKNKGGAAAVACLQMIAMHRKLAGQESI